MQWEEILPHDIAVRWLAWITSLPLVSGMHISRCMGTSNGHESRIQIFCDASEKDYGAALYIRCTSREGILVTLACSKKNARSHEESDIALSRAASGGHWCKVIAVLLPREWTGHQDCHVMKRLHGGYKLDPQ